MSEVQLLFFDTFAHDSGTDLNLDLVKFNREVYISEVRVIPLGARVRADFPGGDRLGATNPSEFTLDFFVNDLSKPGVSAFQKLGTINYDQKGKIQLEFNNKTPTDGLVLRGWYSAVTLAVYGSLTRRSEPAPPPQQQPLAAAADTAVTDCQQEEPAAPEPVRPAPAVPATPPPPPVQVSPPPVQTEPERAVSRTPPRSPPADQRGPPPAPASPSAHKAGGAQEESLHPLSPGDVEAISDDEIPEPAERPASGDDSAPPAAEPPSPPAPPPPAPAAETATPPPPPEPGDAGLEDIMSDEEPMDVLEYQDDEDWEEALRPFNPDTFQLLPLTGLRPPWLTPFELAQLGEEKSEWCDRLAQLAAAYGEQWRPAAGGDGSEAWLEEMETLAPHLPAALGQLMARGGDDPVPAVLGWLEHGLDFEAAVRQQQLPFKLRHIKVGVRLAAALLGCDSALAERLVARGVLDRLAELSEREHMAASVRLLVVTALSTAVRWQTGLQGFVSGEPSGYSRMVAQLAGKMSARLKAAYICLIRKVSLPKPRDITSV
ncbi:Protein virilizer [Amphibalanus amphitrite]|uniref:Protein virilizer n=1 Tax=Amphibalanus amphitrite TaxID=1232801 RepID=A0A6A4VW92_AMPAM|nr:Protein virilizer [Amphibalanus amphitrite]KAF0295885.1 Protein virilizer [Amphibalanus amphitrite]